MSNSKKDLDIFEMLNSPKNEISSDSSNSGRILNFYEKRPEQVNEENNNG